MTQQDTKQHVTFNELCERVPELLALWHEASSCTTTDPLVIWYGPTGFKRRLSDLIGWERVDSSTDPVLYSESAYTVAYHELLNTLERNRDGRRLLRSHGRANINRKTR